MQFGWLCESLQGYWRKSPEVAGRGGGQAGYGRHQPSGLRRVLLRGTGSRSTELPAPKQHNPTVSPCFRLNSLRFSFLFSFCLVSVCIVFLSLSLFLALHFRRDSRTRGYRRRPSRNRNWRARPSFRDEVAKVEACFEYRNYDVLAAVPQSSGLNVQNDIPVSRTSS